MTRIFMGDGVYELRDGEWVNVGRRNKRKERKRWKKEQRRQRGWAFQTEVDPGDVYWKKDLWFKQLGGFRKNEKV